LKEEHKVFTEADKQKMDDAAADAQNDIVDSSVDLEALRVVANWWKKWVPKAGHKRLGRVLLEHADKTDKVNGK